MKKCKSINKSGKDLIKSHKENCKMNDPRITCAGQNKIGTPEVWILVTSG